MCYNYCMSTYGIDSLKGGDRIVLPFRIPSSTCSPAIPKGTVVEVFDTYGRGGSTVLRVISPTGTAVRSVAPWHGYTYEVAS